MLDQETKKQINSARDILVGKVPDPKAQVDQITTALIYKFMDDMDQESKSMGGRASFFTGDFKKYRWPQLLDKKLSGQQRLNLYEEALRLLPNKKDLPTIFRNVFKGAFLPYRDVETFNLFLKEINQFSYENSENLGNAFEYLLSILGSQGDAGQFRTPRHIIDFIVEVLDPKKDETILDPACGTGGFLISAYKHIIKHNSKNFDPNKPECSFVRSEQDALGISIQSNGKYEGTKLKPRERQALQKYIKGYDISPDMVKLSLVNLYLHKFKEPQIIEYDTLTNESLWDDNFDIILANPPFMTPKGGIRPHNKFSISSKRSEVLFVDYIAEHLNINGRAGVIVPEGIVFKSDKAYKALRKMLVEDQFLWAVISLPSGIFKPYSGVKTSILFLDKKKAKVTDEILFIDVQNDGFDLGDTRRKVDENDLPKAFEILCKWREGTKLKDKVAHWVKKSKINADSDWTLQGNSYKEVKARITKWPMVRLGDVCIFEYGKPLKKKDRTGNTYPVYGSNGIIGYHKDFLVKGPFIVVGRQGSAGAITYSKINGFPIDTTFYVKLKKQLDLKFIHFILRSLNLKNINQQAGVPGLNRNDAYKIKIPLPPLDVQKEIVAEIEGYQKIVDGAKQVVDNWKPIIKIDPKWQLVQLEEVCELFNDGDWIESKDQSPNGIRLIQTGNIGSGIYLDKYNKSKFISDLTFNKLDCTEVFEGDILVSRLPDPVGRSCLVPKLKTRSITAVDCTIIRTNKKVIPIFLNFIMQSSSYYDSISRYLTGSSRTRISRKNLGKIEIPLPSLEKQRKVVAEINEEQKYVDSCKKMIKLYEFKITNKIEDVWNTQ